MYLSEASVTGTYRLDRERMGTGSHYDTQRFCSTSSSAPLAVRGQDASVRSPPPADLSDLRDTYGSHRSMSDLNVDDPPAHHARRKSTDETNFYSVGFTDVASAERDGSLTFSCPEIRAVRRVSFSATRHHKRARDLLVSSNQASTQKIRTRLLTHSKSSIVDSSLRPFASTKRFSGSPRCSLEAHVLIGTTHPNGESQPTAVCTVAIASWCCSRCCVDSLPSPRRLLGRRSWSPGFRSRF